MPFVYILRSDKDGNLYTGTCFDLEKRIERHSKGSVHSTRNRRPLSLVYFEEYDTLSAARKREWELKYTPWGGKLKKELAFKAGGSSNGRTSPFGGEYLGSNPSPPALNTKGHKNS